MLVVTRVNVINYISVLMAGKLAPILLSLLSIPHPKMKRSRIKM